MPAFPLRILSVEDDVLNRALLRASLARADDTRLSTAEIVDATNLAEARSAVSQSAFDLVLLDRRLPDGDGFTLAAELRRDGNHRPLIVALTADAVAARTAALDVGCDAILTKPYTPTELVSLLAQHLTDRATL